MHCEWHKRQYEKVVRNIFQYYPDTAFTATDIKNVSNIPPATAHAQLVTLWTQGLIERDHSVGEFHYRATPELIKKCLDFLLKWIPKDPAKRASIYKMTKREGNRNLCLRFLIWVKRISKELNK